MNCANPTDCWAPAVGGQFKFGTHPPKDGHTYSKAQLPCGKCVLCKQNHGLQWAVRMSNEAQLWDESCMATLTYNDKHLPMDHNVPTVRWADGQKFLKRLRKYLAPARFSYYGVTEYGTRSNRPHLHIAIFGYAFLDDQVVIQERPHKLWTSETLERLWSIDGELIGNVSVGALNWQTANYVAGYIIEKAEKHVYARLDEETGELVPLEQPKAYMSRSRDLAIGGRWCDEWAHHIYTHDRVTLAARHHAVPRYYDRRVSLRPAAAVAVRQIKQQRKNAAAKNPDKSAAATRTRASLARARARAARTRI